MMRTLLIAWLCAFSLIASAGFGVSMLGCMLRLGHSAWWTVWRPAFIAARRATVFIAVLYIPVLLGMNMLYPWGTDAEFADQRWFLNTPFAIVRAIVYFVAWFAAGRIALSDGKNAIVKTAAALVILFFVANLAAIDWLMALTPKWHSSVLGLRWVIDGLLVGTGAIVYWAVKADSATGAESARRYIDSANLLFALHLAWLYLMFVDYVTAWSGNLPDEADWYMARFAHGWSYAIGGIVAVHVLICAILLMRGAKRARSMLMAIAALTIVAQWFEGVWTIAPGFDANAAAVSSVSLACAALFSGLATFAARSHLTAGKNREVRSHG